MILEKEIDGLLYSLDTDEQVATVERCVDEERTGEVVVPESFFYEGIVYRVTSIGDYAFFDCSSLTSIYLPDGVTTIGRLAFSGCSSLTAIIIPEGVTSIGDCAFSDCSSLTTLTIPQSVTSIGGWAFSGCSSLGDISVDERNTIYDSREGCNAVIETNSNTLVVGCAKTVIPESVTSIGDYAFKGCKNLIAITIPQSVTSIGNSAFDGCSSLTSITIPQSVTSIGASAFYSCSSLTTITIPEGVTSIGASAFYGCSSLTAITIPEGVTSIGNGAFSGCSSLTTIIVAKRNTIYDSREGCNAVIETNSNTLVVGCAKTVIPEGVTSIGDSAFHGCSSLTAITIPESVTSIGIYAFYDCSSLKTITIPQSVTIIRRSVFSDCSSLTSILIPQNVKHIWSEALMNSGITYLTILGKPTIGINAFDECEKLTDVYCYSEETPQAEYAFDYFNLSRITLHVPESAIEAYKNTEPWSRSGTIVAIE